MTCVLEIQGLHDLASSVVDASLGTSEVRVSDAVAEFSALEDPISCIAETRQAMSTRWGPG